MKTLVLNEEFTIGGNVYHFTEKDSQMVLKWLRKGSKAKSKEFVPPTIDEVKAYFEQEGYDINVVERAFRHYNTADWHNSKGKKVRNWRQTMSTNWMTPENKVKEQPKESKDTKDPKFMF